MLLRLFNCINMTMHIKKDDKVIVITGKYKGKTATVKKVLPTENRVVLEGLNLMKRHTKPRRAGEKGGIVEVEMPINASNVKPVEKKVKKEKVKKEKPVKKTK